MRASSKEAVLVFKAIMAVKTSRSFWMARASAVDFFKGRDDGIIGHAVDPAQDPHSFGDGDKADESGAILGEGWLMIRVARGDWTGSS